MNYLNPFVTNWLLTKQQQLLVLVYHFAIIEFVLTITFIDLMRYWPDTGKERLTQTDYRQLSEAMAKNSSVKLVQLYLV